MKKPLQATLTTPPLVDHVAVGEGDVVDGLTGRVVGGTPSRGVATVVAGDGGPGTPGCVAWAGGAAVTGALEPAGAAPRPRDGTAVVVLLTLGVVLGGGALAADGDFSSLTTSWWARTGAGRSVTSAATMDVAVQTTAVDATVTANQSPVASKRAGGTSRGCTFGAA